MENETKEIQEEKADLDLPVGTKEQAKLKAGLVKVDAVSIDEVPNKEGKVVGKKVVCLCKHPDKQEMVSISSAKYQVKDKIKTAGLWFNKDDEGFIAKNSALAHLMKKIDAKTVSEISSKEIETTPDDNDYLCFKAY